MSDAADHDPFEDAFHRAAERHERAWVFVAITLLVTLLAGTMFFVVYDYGVVVRTDGFRADPAAIPAAPAGLVQAGPNAYSVQMVGHLWAWSPSPLHVPQGATVTFHVTSTDVLHGFQIQNTTVNVTAIPGVTGTATYTFSRAGTFNIICNEFCGIEHQAMLGRIIVDPVKP
ncbi:MAG: cytochrome C oxidase subunit II [Alphaproteobacteria bacterium]|jgi:cytochrome c oxidase subunit 2|nr:MAG: cytochrome C oxidase subunit II [Alphaproteobacteria bacterium]